MILRIFRMICTAALIAALATPSASARVAPAHKTPSGSDWVKRLDRNRDGKVSRSEFDGPRNHFSHFDKDNNGYIIASEAPSGPPSGQPRGLQRQMPDRQNEGKQVMNKYTGKLIKTVAGAAVAATMVAGCEDSKTASTGTVNGYTIVDTSQSEFYNNSGRISKPSASASFHGQDAYYSGTQPSFRDNDDGTISDLNTGLIWQKDPGDKMTYDEAAAGAASFTLAGHSDWRLPTIKELYSLIDFRGEDPSGYEGSSTEGLEPFIDTDYFTFRYGNETGERIIDSQYASSTLYKSNTANDGGRTLFGVNFADGRIKGYGLSVHGSDKTFYVMYVRGQAGYGQNSFVDNGDGTITDLAAGLMWQKADSGSAMDWEDSLKYAENLSLAGNSDWRLPNVKELQSIVDYDRSPATTGSAAIDPAFSISAIINEAGAQDYACFWSATTHANSNGGGQSAAYVAFGRAMGYMQGRWQDVHGAGAQRSDPKQGNASDYPQGRGPQGDAIRILNYVRCVRSL